MRYVCLRIRLGVLIVHMSVLSLTVLNTTGVRICSLVYSCSNTGSISNAHYWISREDLSEIVLVSGINEVSLG